MKFRTIIINFILVVTISKIKNVIFFYHDLLHFYIEKQFTKINFAKILNQRRNNKKYISIIIYYVDCNLSYAKTLYNNKIISLRISYGIDPYTNLH
ncbi:hypothetical protein B6S12_01505 [Helicobacter valdiviensis]|uniref:Uncharacterized protein n=1 Tax=Helicobacter valdiviensis TaxID=1458358 RepID=A0A2W6MX63_9HELI|nr:hypothetical protein B6S12_01505 [Helicobacter valdiviensis]